MKTAIRFRSNLGPTLLFTASYSLLSCDCEKDKGQEVTVIAQRLKAGLHQHKLRLSRTTNDGIQTYTPIGNFGRFGADGMIVARVASVDIRCNQGELVKLWLDQSRRADWDTSCSSIKIIATSDTDTTGDLKPVNTTHFVEQAELGPLFPLRDYVIQVFEPFPGKRWYQSLHITELYFTSFVGSIEVYHTYSSYRCNTEILRFIHSWETSCPCGYGVAIKSSICEHRCIWRSS